MIPVHAFFVCDALRSVSLGVVGVFFRRLLVGGGYRRFFILKERARGAGAGERFVDLV